MVRHTDEADEAKFETVTHAADVNPGDTIDVSGPSFLPKSNLTVDKVGVDYDHPYDGVVVEASLDRKNARSYSFLITDGGFVKTTDSSGRFTDAVDMKVEGGRANDATRFVNTAIRGEKAVESHDVVVDAGSHHTAESNQFGDDDFDDDGMYVGDEDVYAVVSFRVDADAPAWEVFEAVDELAESAWEVDRKRTRASFTSPGRSGKPVGSPPEDEDDKNHTTRFEARKQIA